MARIGQYQPKQEGVVSVHLTLSGDALKAVDLQQEKKHKQGVKVYGKELAINHLLCELYRAMKKADAQVINITSKDELIDFLSKKI